MDHSEINFGEVTSCKFWCIYKYFASIIFCRFRDTRTEAILPSGFVDTSRKLVSVGRQLGEACSQEEPEM